MGVELNNFARGLCLDSSGLFSDIGTTHSEDVMNGDTVTVKHTLKSKILERRKHLGLDNVKVDFTPKKSYPLTEEEKEKDRKRKQSNRDSAQKCRRKQKEEHENNKKLLKQLKDQHEELLDKVKETEDEKNKVLFSLRKMLPEAYIHEALRQIRYSKSIRTDTCGQVGLENSDQAELSDEIPTESHEDGVSFTEDAVLNLEDNCDDGLGEILFSSLLNVSGYIGNVNGNVEPLEVGQEVTLQLLDNELVSHENTVPVAHSNIPEKPDDINPKLLGGSTFYIDRNTLECSFLHM